MQSVVSSKLLGTSCLKEAFPGTHSELKGKPERKNKQRESGDVQLIPVIFNIEAKVSVFVSPSILGR